MTSVLIVEDSPTQAEELRLILESEGFRAETAANAQVALEHVARSGFDLVISDIVMPGMSGFDLCRRLKNEPATKDTPVMLVTSLSDPMDIIRGLESGADQFLTKPYEPDQLVARVRNVLEHRRLRRDRKPDAGIQIVFLGRNFVISSDKQQILDLLIATFEDMVRTNLELRATQIATKLAADRLESAVEIIQDAFALFDGSDRLVLCNSTYRRLLGESLAGPLVGRPYEQLLQAWLGNVDFPDAAARERFCEERLGLRHQEQTATSDVRTLDGRSLRIIDRRTPDGGIVTTVWDLTDDEERAAELRQARAVAEAASAAKSDFLSSMSHELRTPLNAILGFAQLLRRDKKEPPSERNKERVDQILRGGEHLLRLIDDILDLSRIEAGGVSISTEPVDVVDVLKEVRETLEPMAVHHGIRVEFEAPPDPPMVAADRTRFAQILMNFGSNAIKYNRPAGSVTFAVSQPRAGFVRVTVRDTGMGIPADKQDKLFQPFQRAGQETGPIQGTGIGLVITKRLARLMGGDVDFRSVWGEGSDFWIDIPVHLSGAHSSAPPPAREARSEPGPREGRRLVLYVEDNPANVTFMRDLVSTFETVDLLTAPTAEMGVELSRGRRPDVIIMDVNLPGMSGVDALGALRAIPETKDIPVIALTAAASEHDKERGIEAGFAQYLTKPVNVDEFVTALEALLAWSG